MNTAQKILDLTSAAICAEKPEVPYSKYTSTKPLECCEFPNRVIGVRTSGPRHNAVTGEWGADLQMDTVSASTRAFGTWYKGSVLGEQIKSATRDVIADLDNVISELQAHRARLERELEA